MSVILLPMGAAGRVMVMESWSRPAGARSSLRGRPMACNQTCLPGRVIVVFDGFESGIGKDVVSMVTGPTEAFALQ